MPEICVSVPRQIDWLSKSKHCTPRGGGGGGGGGEVQKNEYFWGKKILWIFFGDHHKIGLYLGVISMHFRVFS